MKKSSSLAIQPNQFYLTDSLKETTATTPKNDYFYSRVDYNATVNRFGLLWDPATNETIRAAVGPTAPLFGWLTHLGDSALLLVLGVLIYWFGAQQNRRSRIFVIAVGVAVLALSAGIKGVVQLPRPTLAFAPQGYPGYTFPSAHAMGSAGFYGALAVTMTWGTRRLRYLVAGTLIAVIAFSRVVMGVHYPGDVVVGTALGIGLVAIGVWTRTEGVFDPGPLFALAVVLAGGAALLGSQVFVTLTLGASIGGVIGWYAVQGRPTTRSDAAILVSGIGLLAAIGVLRSVSLWIGIGAPGSSARFLAEIVGYAVLTTLVLLLPWLAIRIEDHPIVRELQARLPFQRRGVGVENPSSRR